MASENKQKSLPRRCAYCNARFNDDLHQLLEEDDEPVYCELCGTEVRIHSTQESQTHKKGSKKARPSSKKKHKKKRSKQKRKQEIQHLNPITHIGFDPEFPLIFKENLMLVLSRITYLSIKKVDDIEALKNSNREISKELLDQLEHVLEPTTWAKIKINFLGKLHKLTIDQFYEHLKRLQKKIQENEQYHEHFIIFLRYIINNTFRIISEMWEAPEIPKFFHVIRKDLKNYGFDAYTKEHRTGDKIIEKNIDKCELNNSYDVKIKIENDEIRKVYESLKCLFGYTISEIANLIDIELESLRSALYRGNAIPETAFKKLESLYGESIPHTRMIGRNEEKILLKNDDSAELVGIMVCDGHLSEKIIETSISLNGIDDPEYLDYVIGFLMDIFNIELEYIRIDTYDESKLSLIRLNKQTYLNALLDLGLVAGDKVQNQIDIPSWIFNNNLFVIRCLKGMIDTDGTIQINKDFRCFRISFRNASRPLVISFKEMCKAIGINTGSVIHSKIFDSRYEKYYDSHYVSVSKKSDVRKFIEIVKPKKFEFRKQYYGTWLLILENELIYESLKEDISHKFPKENDRAFSKEFSDFLYSRALEYNLKLTDEEFDRVINEAFTYKRCIYTKKLGNLFSIYYKKLGSRNVIREYLEFYDIINPLPSTKTVSNFIRKYLAEENNINFFEWKKQYAFNNVAIDAGKISYFPNILRTSLIKEIFDIHHYHQIDEISIIFNRILFETDNIYLIYLFENEKYSEACKIYIDELIALVIVLIDMILEDRIKSDLYIKQNYEISFSTSTISYIKKEVKSLFEEKKMNV